SFVIAQTIVSGNNDGWMMIYTPQLEEKEQSQDDIFNCQFNNNEDIIECIKRSYALSFNQNQWVGINIENLPQNRFDGNDPRDEEIKHYFITWIYNKADSTDTREISFRKFNEHLQIIRIYEGNCNENRECSFAQPNDPEAPNNQLTINNEEGFIANYNINLEPGWNALVFSTKRFLDNQLTIQTDGEVVLPNYNYFTDVENHLSIGSIPQNFEIQEFTIGEGNPNPEDEWPQLASVYCKDYDKDLKFNIDPDQVYYQPLCQERCFFECDSEIQRCHYTREGNQITTSEDCDTGDTLENYNDAIRFFCQDYDYDGIRNVNEEEFLENIPQFCENGCTLTCESQTETQCTFTYVPDLNLVNPRNCEAADNEGVRAQLQEYCKDNDRDGISSVNTQGIDRDQPQICQNQEGCTVLCNNQDAPLCKFTYKSNGNHEIENCDINDEVSLKEVCTIINGEVECEDLLRQENENPIEPVLNQDQNCYDTTSYIPQLEEDQLLMQEEQPSSRVACCETNDQCVKEADEDIPAFCFEQGRLILPKNDICDLNNNWIRCKEGIQETQNTINSFATHFCNGQEWIECNEELQMQNSIDNQYLCYNNKWVTPETDCSNEEDDGGAQELTDCQDPTCNARDSCEFGTELSCSDGINNDGDDALFLCDQGFNECNQECNRAQTDPCYESCLDEGYAPGYCEATCPGTEYECLNLCKNCQDFESQEFDANECINNCPSIQELCTHQCQIKCEQNDQEICPTGNILECFNGCAQNANNLCQNKCQAINQEYISKPDSYLTGGADC
ncbi:hypothetical protein HON15_03135, partial [Candidatus Woesearchaeota archaeon]|nr:hypothetical protein [Candidatus Woesearchaeota archaeon]